MYDGLNMSTGLGVTKQKGDGGEEGTAECVQHPEGRAIQQRRVKGKEGVTSPHQEREEEPCSHHCQSQLQFLTAQILAQV